MALWRKGLSATLFCCLWPVPGAGLAAEYYELEPESYVKTTFEMFGKPLTPCIGIARPSYVEAAISCLAVAPDRVEGETATIYGVMTKLGTYYAHSQAVGVHYDVKMYYKTDGRLFSHTPSENFLIKANRTMGPHYLFVADGPDRPDVACGNPINVATGEKIQSETDIVLTNGITLSRHYHSNGAGGVLGPRWRHSYEHALRVVDLHAVDEVARDVPAVYLHGVRSSEHATAYLACTSGWPQIQSRVRQPWAPAALAVYDWDNRRCSLLVDGAEVMSAHIASPYASAAAIGDTRVVQISRGDGSVQTFYPASNGWSGDKHQPTQLFADGIDAGHGWRYRRADNAMEVYAGDGRLLQIEDPGAETTVLEYDATTGRLVRVSLGRGITLGFHYQPDGRLAGLMTSAGEAYHYYYGDHGRLAGVTHVDDAANRQYHYEDSRFPHALTGITDERGVRYATWTYDAQGRAISSQHADGADRTTLAYHSDGSTTVTNPLGKQTTYRFTTIHGVRKVTSVEGNPTASCAGANRAYTFTPEGWVASKTDWAGNLTTHSYDSQGREISRTEAAGTPAARTIMTEWHPTLRLPMTITEPHQVTELSYDDRGRLVSRVARALQ
jgi:YD repeat-containing protein